MISNTRINLALADTDEKRAARWVNGNVQPYAYGRDFQTTQAPALGLIGWVMWKLFRL